jgi:hypothetical protein
MEAAMREWLEVELSERLAPVHAPDDLWRRVNESRPASGMALPLRQRALPIAAVVTLILAGALWFMARGAGRQASYRQFPASARAESCLLCHTTM